MFFKKKKYITINNPQKSRKNYDLTYDNVAIPEVHTHEAVSYTHLRILISCSFSSFKTTRSTSPRSLSGKSSRISLFSKCTPPFFTCICLSARNIPPICLDTPSYLY